MFFNDLSFVPFLALSIVCLQLTPLRWRWVTLLILSLLFYATFRAPALLAVLAADSCIAWGTARIIERRDDDTARWRIFLVGTGGLLVVLVMVRLATRPNLLPPSSLPRAWFPSAIGVSYFTLQAISYIADVYLRRLKAERNPGRMIAYLGLYPKLLQGPIERASGMLQQLAAPQLPRYEGLRSAAVLFGWGLFKKVVLGDRLARIVDPVFADPSHFAGLTTSLAVYAFAFQLYFDFSGYTDMARGTARSLGIELTENFRAPYLATGIIEFWRRWHITFSRWLLDYVFTPLQLSWRRFGIGGTAAALFATFALSGVWHGFAWTFVIWGLLHGCYLAAEVFWRGWRRRGAPRGAASRLVGTVITFNLVTFAWVFFRAPSVAVALTLLSAIPHKTSGVDRLLGQLGQQWVIVTLAACLAYTFFVALRDHPVFERLSRVATLRWIAYTVLFLTILLLRQDGAAYFYSQF